MTFRKEMEAMAKEYRIAKHPTAAEMYEQRWANLDKYRLPSSAAGTEKAIVKFLQMKGHHAAKVEVKGTYQAPQFEEVAMGRLQTRKGKFLPSGARKGSADVTASIYGVAVFVEVKYSASDRQSPDQKKFQRDVESSGGIYFVARNVEDFYETYVRLLDHPMLILMKDYHKNNKEEI